VNFIEEGKPFYSLIFLPFPVPLWFAHNDMLKITIGTVVVHMMFVLLTLLLLLYFVNQDASSQKVKICAYYIDIMTEVCSLVQKH